MPKLAELSRSQSFRIIAVHGDDDLALRLMEMGLLPGASAKLLGRAPLGGPLDLELGDGYRLSIGQEEAQRVEVEAG